MYAQFAVQNRDTIIVMIVKFNVFRIVYTCQPELELAVFFFKDIDYLRIGLVSFVFRHSHINQCSTLLKKKIDYSCNDHLTAAKK